MMVPTPSVAITELTFILVTMKPLTRPISAPRASTMKMARGIGSLSWTMKPVTRMPCRLAAKPIDRSSSPTTTANVRPPAMIMASEAWLRTLVKLPRVENAFGDRIEKATIIANNPRMVA